MPDPPSTSDAPWPTTLWPLMRDLDKPGHRRMASEILAARYWRPVYAALRRKGHDHHDAADFTQEFFLALFTRDWALRADEKKGRFRTFLSTLLFRFVRDLGERRQARFERKHEGLQFDIAEDDARLLDWKAQPSPENVFWLQYARDILDRALTRFREEAGLVDGRPGEAFARVFLRRIDDAVEGRRTGWDALGREFSMTPSQARYAFKKGLELFRERFALELGEEGDAAGRLQDAVKELLAAIK